MLIPEEVLDSSGLPGTAPLRAPPRLQDGTFTQPSLAVAASFTHPVAKPVHLFFNFCLQLLNSY